jgi:hypothetical protein
VVLAQHGAVHWADDAHARRLLGPRRIGSLVFGRRSHEQEEQRQNNFFCARREWVCMHTCVRGRDLMCVVPVVFKITLGMLPPAFFGSHKAWQRQ